MQWNNFLTKLLLLLILLWIGIAFVRTIYNVSKLATEERQLLFLSDEQKRALDFGDKHYFLRFVQSHTKTGSSILFFTDDVEAHYLGRYYLYPTKVIQKQDYFIWRPKASYYDYIMIYPANSKLTKEAFAESNIKKYKKFATYKGINGELGLIYKK
jgi:hypothetical protein